VQIKQAHTDNEITKVQLPNLSLSLFQVNIFANNFCFNLGKEYEARSCIINSPAISGELRDWVVVKE